MTNGFTPLLTTTDWGAEWTALQASRRRPDNADYWSSRAKSFGSKAYPNPYATRFLELAGVRPGETVLDMGCGTGALAVPLGEAGQQVIAADFSQGMLDQLQQALDQHGIATVTPKLLSWEDDWDALGLPAKSVDVCLASRSIATSDMRASLLRLSRTARRRVCVTLTTGASPRVDDRLMAQIGLGSRLGHDYLYAFNILANEGLKPEVAYIESQRTDTFDSRAEADETLGRMVRDVLGPNPADDERETALAKLAAWLDANLVENPNAGQPDGRGGTEAALKLATPRTITWAFISWNVEG